MGHWEWSLVTTAQTLLHSKVRSVVVQHRPSEDLIEPGGVEGEWRTWAMLTRAPSRPQPPSHPSTQSHLRSRSSPRDWFPPTSALPPGRGGQETRLPAGDRQFTKSRAQGDQMASAPNCRRSAVDERSFKWCSGAVCESPTRRVCRSEVNGQTQKDHNGSCK